MRNLEKALGDVCGKRAASGLDGITPHALRTNAESYLLWLQRQLLGRAYSPSLPRQVHIPKPSGGTRTINIPSILDRLVGRAILNVIGPPIEACWPEHSFAFRRGRRALDAVQMASREVARGGRWACLLDIAKFFDTIDRGRLDTLLSEKFTDPDLLWLLRQFLHPPKAPHAAGAGIPQGSVLSPFFSNIYLESMDRTLAAEGWKVFRYADDLLGVVRTKENAIALRERVAALLSDARLELAPNKCRIVRFKTGVEYLGFRLSDKAISLHPETAASHIKRVEEMLRRGRRSERRLSGYITAWNSYYSRGVTDNTLFDVERLVLALLLRHGRRDIAKMLDREQMADTAQ